MEADGSGCCEKLTVAAIKTWMAKKGLDTGGKKAELVERVEGYFESK